MKTETFSVPISETLGSVSAEVIAPEKMMALITLAHGAGADMNHRFMKALAKALADRGIGTLRYNFPYMEKKKGRPDPPAIAEKTVAVVIEKARELYPQVLLLAGGKSFGGRMTSQYVSKNPPSSLTGIVFYGFPLHPAGNPSTDRAVHLQSIHLPMLFLQGTRDTLADLSLIKQITSDLPAAKLKLFEGADHSFSIGKKELTVELAEATGEWLKEL